LGDYGLVTGSDIHGRFWLPGSEEQSCEGVLVQSSGQPCELKIEGQLTPIWTRHTTGEGESALTSYEPILDLPPATVLGVDDDGVPMVLLDAYPVAGHWSGHPLAPARWQEFRGDPLITGTHVRDRDHKWTSARFETQFLEWVIHFTAS
jgi:hypothetical protein